jgi:D-alanine transaminase
MPMPIVYLNGRFLPERKAGISPLDRGFLFADAIYEVVRYDRGRPYRLAEHLERMREGLDAIQIKATPDFFAAAGERLLAENGLSEKDAFVYAQISRGPAARYHAFPPKGTKPTFFAFAREVDPAPPPDGGKAILLTDERWGRCDIKSVMLLANVLAAQRAHEAGAIDAILVRDGFALEATKANLFIVAKGVVRTAPNGPRILPGVTRSAAIEAALRIGLTVEERAFTLEEMYAAQELFLASTTLWTYPIVSVEGRPIGSGKGGPVARMIRDALMEEFKRGSRESEVPSPKSRVPSRRAFDAPDRDPDN